MTNKEKLKKALIETLNELEAAMRRQECKIKVKQDEFIKLVIERTGLK